MDSKEYQSWREKVYRPDARQERSVFVTSSGFPVEPVYGPWDAPDAGERLGMPGEYPFTRGIHPSMYRGRLWTMRQYAGFSTAEESNERYRYLLEQGQTGLSVAFDLPTQIGYDSDDPMAQGEVGRVGVAIDTVEDMETLLAGIPLEKVSVSMTINATASVLLAMVLAVARRRGVDWEKLSGTVQNDILKEYIARGTYRFPPRPSLRLITDLVAFCTARVPRWNTISISGYHIREAGSTAVQEVAFTLANAREYVRAAVDAGIPIDEFAPRLSFFFNAHSNFLEEVAKFRAARRMWARMMREEFGAADPRSWLLRFHTQTAGSTLTAQQPENNVVRVAIQAMAAVAGGTQSLHTNAMDEALSLPSEGAVRVALRTQQIVGHESGLADVVDPLGGAWVVEAWTDRIEQEARAYLDTIQKMGGALAAIERGFQQREIHEAAYRTQRAIESGEQVVVGVNRFRIDREEPMRSFRVDEAAQKAQVERREEVRRHRDGARVKQTLAALEAAASGRENLMPLLVDAVEASASLGEIAGTLVRVFGEHREGVAL
ncbi:MAG: methylmalonyl-CoA mutase family protein [Thermoanaerobaculaceae bacterium]|nr:methylmalonyl-CoA mutase family protein [Thermoanaerobaculaceae bacterium]